jgi:4-diphosphocytidyl-2C-methyl-D-erythritol kinase
VQEKINADAVAFRTAYPDVDINSVPAEVWDRVDKGYSLTDAYQIHENKTLKEKIAAQEKAIQVKETNQKNAVTSPGSVTGNGATVADYISQESFEQNKGDQRWIIKNFEKIQESRKKWK